MRKALLMLRPRFPTNGQRPWTRQQRRALIDERRALAEKRFATGIRRLRKPLRRESRDADSYPQFRFTPAQVDALVAWMRALPEGERPPV